MADNVDFFKQDSSSEEAPKEGAKTEGPEKISVGDTEYTPEEIEKLVGKGKKVSEFEKKQGQSFEDVTKSWGKRGERIGELKKKLGKLEKARKVPKPGEALTEEQVKMQVIEEAKKYGLLTKEEATEMFGQLYQQKRSGEKILQQTNKVIRAAKKAGKPAVTAEKLLEFMADPDNPKNPDKAYKLMFEKELDKWKEERLMKTRKPGLVTETKGAASKKTPKVKTPKSYDELQSALKEHFTGG